MIDNSIVQCKYCKSVIRLRFQMGFFDIPFDICCPKCGVHINGWRRIVEDNSLSINNAEVIVRPPHEVDYYADLSVELPTRKILKYESEEAIHKIGFSPFMITNRYFSSETYSSIMERIGNFFGFRENLWPQIQPLINLLFSGNVTLAKERFLDFSECYIVENELDATIALHQMLIVGIDNLLPNGMINEFMQFPIHIYQEQNLRKVVAFIQELGGTDYLNSLSKRFVTVLSKWFLDYEKYNPVVMLSLGNALNKIDKDLFGITTTSFENIKAFYSYSYELLLEMIELAVGLNNLTIRNDFNAFHPSVKLSNFASFRNQAKPEKLKALIAEETFSKPIQINRHIRNSIAHFNYEFEPNSQRILFFDNYKGKENKTTIYLADLALLCYENIKILIYLNELLYNLKKLDFLFRGFVPHIKPISGYTPCSTKKIEVVAAIISDGDRIFATQRGYGDWKDFWEFPHGKVEPGEDPLDALDRKIWEELGAKIMGGVYMTTIEYDYPDFHLSMHCYLTRIKDNEFTLKEHEAARWLTKDELDSVDWLPADQTIVERLKRIL